MRRSIRVEITSRRHQRLIDAWDNWTEKGCGSESLREALEFYLDFLEAQGPFATLANIPISSRMAELAHRLRSKPGGGLTLGAITAALRNTLRDFSFTEKGRNGLEPDTTTEFAARLLGNLDHMHEIDDPVEDWEV